MKQLTAVPRITLRLVSIDILSARQNRGKLEVRFCPLQQRSWSEWFSSGPAS